MDPEELEVTTGFAPAASLGRSSVVRMGAVLATLVFGFATSVFTARSLGPTDKGTLSTLSFFGDILFLYTCGLGLGEASILLVRRRVVTLQDALSAGLLPLLVAGSLGVAGLFIVAIPADWFAIADVVALQGMALLFAIFGAFFLALLNVDERFVFTSGVLGLRFAVVAVVTLVLVVVLRFGLAGAVLASCVGYALAAALAARKLRAIGLSLRPRFHGELIRVAIGSGVPLLASHLLLAMSQRADQVVAYSLAGPAEGGLYSISLALVQISAYAPLVLSHVSFPRLASLPDAQAAELTARLARIGFVGSLGIAIVLAAAIPSITTFVFGPGFAGAVTPALILLPGAVLWSQQWVLARAQAARGRNGLVVTSFLASVTVMLLLDLVLIPLWGLVGAALASVSGSTIGFLICVIAYRRANLVRLGELVPRWNDVRSLVDQVISLVRAVRGPRAPVD